MHALSEVTKVEPEPMVNIAAYRSGEEWTVLVFPRSKHRPRVYETGELTVSPAVPSDFGRMRAADIESILTEVTLPADQFKQTLARVGGKP
jgi:hypothetical protein